MLVDEEGNPPGLTTNDNVPWYYIEFDYKDPAFRKHFDLGISPNASGEYGYHADEPMQWYTDASQFNGDQWHNERYKSGNYNAGSFNSSTNDMEGATFGYMRIDTLQPLPDESKSGLLGENIKTHTNDPNNTQCRGKTT